MCEMTEVLELPDKFECMTCGHEWTIDAEDTPAGDRVVKDAFGNVLANGDI
jgi:protein PhnA